MRKKISGSEAVLLSLLEENVEHIFGYPGGAIMPIYDALFDYEKKLKHILVRHEQCAAHAAQGYSRVNGKVGVCFATSGPGATNLVTGITDAYMDSTPLVCITGQVASTLIGSNAFQETDIIGITTPITKWNYQISDPQEIPKIIAKAFFIAKSGRPGPVLVDITKDAQFGVLDFKYEKCTSLPTYTPLPVCDNTSIKKAVELINKAKKPLILFGQGVLLSNAENEFKTFVEKTGIPAAWTILGLGALPTKHPFNVGMLGMHGNYGPNIKTNEADLIIAIGMRFDDRVTGKLDEYATEATIIHIDIDPSEVNKNIAIDVSLVGDAKAILIELNKNVLENEHSNWLKEFKDCYETEYEKVIKKAFFPKIGELKMAEVINLINEFTKGEAIIVTDVGQHQMVTVRYAEMNTSRLNVTSGGLGTMGFALPAAIGAKIGNPNREVVAIIGDGGFQMNINELATVFQEGLDIKIIILNNNFLGMVRQWQELFFENRYSSVDILNPDFVKVAEGFRLNGVKIEKREELCSKLKEVFASKKTSVVEIVVEKEGNVFPMVATGESVSNIRLE